MLYWISVDSVHFFMILSRARDEKAPAGLNRGS